jgi:hypothetical protein
MNHAITALARRNDPDRFLTALFAPAEKRGALLIRARSSGAMLAACGCAGRAWAAAGSGDRCAIFRAGRG